MMMRWRIGAQGARFPRVEGACGVGAPRRVRQTIERPERLNHQHQWKGRTLQMPDTL